MNAQQQRTEIPSPLRHPELRDQVRSLCSQFGADYWRRLDRERSYPHEFVDALTGSRLLSALIPQEYGGLGLGLSEASVILEEINRSGGHSAACHGQLYTMRALLNHGSPWQRETYLPGIADGSIRLQGFSVTEQEAGSDTLSISTRAVREGEDWVISGHKSWTSRIDETDLLLVLARTSDPDPEHRTAGLTLFLADLRIVRQEQPDAVRPTPVRTMFNYATNQVTYDRLRLPPHAVVGAVGEGFRHVLDGMNSERILLAAEAIGDGYWFVEQASRYAGERHVFQRPIGQNQGVQFPIADAYMKVRAADALRWEACTLADSPGSHHGPEANMVKHLASEASWEAANVCLNTFGGYGFVDEYDVERKFRETRMFQVAPVNNNLIKAYVATKLLGMPRSY